MKNGRIFKQTYVVNGKDGKHVRKQCADWWIQWYENGRRCYLKVGPNRKKAEDALRRKLNLKELRRTQRTGLADNHVKLALLKDEYLAAAKQRLKPGTVWNYTETLDSILADLNAIYVEDLGPQQIRSYADMRLSGDNAVSARTVNIHVGALKAMLNWGVRDQMIESNPINQVKPVRQVEKAYRRAMTGDEIAALRDNVKECYRKYWPIWQTFLLTGMRLTELVELRWGDVDMEREEIRIRPEVSKNGRGRTLPITVSLMETFKSLRQSASDTSPAVHVFLNRRGAPWRNNLLTRFRDSAISAEINLKGLCIHSLRHTFATGLIRGGAPPTVVQDLLGHSDIRITLEIYSHVFPPDRRVAVDKLSYADACRNSGELDYNPVGGKAASVGNVA